jgi:hypothetical protein
VDAPIDELRTELPPDALGGGGETVGSGRERDVIQSHVEIVFRHSVDLDTGVGVS